MIWNLTDEELADIDSWEREAELELVDSVVQQRFLFCSFVSRSWGRGRPRKHWVEVALIKDTYSNEGWVSYHRFPFDIKACEVYGVYSNDLDGLEYEQRLMNEIKTCRRR